MNHSNILCKWKHQVEHHPPKTCYFATAHPRMEEPAEDKILLMFAVMQQSSDLIGLWI
jgi:hypothetical protein